MKIKLEVQPNYCYLFNYKTGENVTMGKQSIFMHDSGPNLLDVSITNRCNRCCDFCYRESSFSGEDITLQDYQLILDNAKECGVQQIAIGGGEPTLHPDFCKILKMTRENGIIPNYSSNGENFTSEILLYSKKYCGAIAISIYSDITKYEKLVNSITDANVRINLHLILRADRIEEYISILRNPPKWLSRVNAIIFLNYKPTNGNTSICFKNCPPDTINSFFESLILFDTCGVGFDTCTVSFICKHLEIDNSLFDFCEAGRKSAYINEKLDVYPCSFYKLQQGSDSLRCDTLKSIWKNSKIFKEHRELLSDKNVNCEKMHVCRSGCPLYEINLCRDCNVSALYASM